MFIFTKSNKELVVTAGVLISCGLFVVEAVHGIHRGIWSLALGLFLLMLVIAVLLGNKVGYLVTRYIWRAEAFSCLFGAVLNPIAWSDAFVEGFSLIRLALLILPAAICLSYCLSEHAKLRRLDGAERWRSFP
jgi:hypothetical protein